MMNFNTYQTRHFYVAGAVDANVDTNLDIAAKTAATGEMFFAYRNADGLLTRSDTFDPKKIVSLKKTAAADMARPLPTHLISIDTNVVTLANLVGKTLDCIITVHGVFDYDEDNTITVTASVVGNATNTASATAFHKDLAIAIAKALPKFDKQYPLFRVYSYGTEVTSSTDPSNVTGSANGVVLVSGLQKYVRGKLSGEPCNISVAFRLADGNLGDIAWGKDAYNEKGSAAVKKVDDLQSADKTSITEKVYPAVYVVADLEYFALGERGDLYRGSMWPNDIATTYAIDLSSSYDILTIEYYWQGGAENVQKSPRMIQVAGSNQVVGSLYDTVEAAMAGMASS